MSSFSFISKIFPNTPCDFLLHFHPESELGRGWLGSLYTQPVTPGIERPVYEWGMHVGKETWSSVGACLKQNFCSIKLEDEKFHNLLILRWAHSNHRLRSRGEGPLNSWLHTPGVELSSHGAVGGRGLMEQIMAQMPQPLTLYKFSRFS